MVAKLDNHLEGQLVDVGAATKIIIDKIQVSTEKRTKFKRECKKMVISILIKFQEYSSLKYSPIKNSSSFVPKTVVRQS